MLEAPAKNWLSQSAIPLWLGKGVDWQRGGFYENLTFEGEPTSEPKRTMVQARQIYSFGTAAGLGLCDVASAHRAIESGLGFLLERCSLASGAFCHSVDVDGKPYNQNPDLYSQAFAVFGLAHAYALKPDVKLRERALEVLRYLGRERRAPGGGYTELHASGVLFESNPHMHLFEAALAWMEVDADPAWRSLAEEMANLCVTKFVDSSTGMLCEHFAEGWAPIRVKGDFIFEPGHHYEWAWLLGRYEKMGGRDLQSVRLKLWETAEKWGINPARRAVYDEVWSSGVVKSKSSRFWPQCERIKAALQLGLENSADESAQVLFKFFETDVQGLWFDRWEVSGEFSGGPVKASSLYHIIGALSELLRQAK